MVLTQKNVALALMAICLLGAAMTQAFVVPAPGRALSLHTRSSTSQHKISQQHDFTHLLSGTSSCKRKRDLIKMEVDPAVIGGVIAGVVGVSLGVGAMIFTEKQTLRREERKAADKEKAARAQRAAAAAAASTAAQSSEGGSQGGDGGIAEDEDGW